MVTLLETAGLVALLLGALYWVVRLQSRPACQPGKGSCGCSACPLQSQCGLIDIAHGRVEPAEKESHDPSLPAHGRPDGTR
jgi:hypothetical protein